MNKKLISSSVKKETGSALVVTIMLTSVMLILAVVVLQRIIPYSRQIRDMQDSTQAYYAATSEVEKGLQRISSSDGGNTTPAQSIDDTTDNGNLRVDIPTLSALKQNIASRITATANGDRTNTINKATGIAAEKLLGISTTIGKDDHLPLAVKMYPTDVSARAFGTSPRNSSKHVLPTFGSIAFDMTGIKTDTSFELNLESDDGAKKISIEFSYQGDTTSIPETFFGETSSSTKDILDTQNNDGIGTTLQQFLAARNCETAYSCSLALTLKESTTPIDFKLSGATSDIIIPDLNTVLVADGMSENGEYHSRIIEVKEKTQGI